MSNTFQALQTKYRYKYNDIITSLTSLQSLNGLQECQVGWDSNRTGNMYNEVMGRVRVTNVAVKKQ